MLSGLPVMSSELFSSLSADQHFVALVSRTDYKVAIYDMLTDSLYNSVQLTSNIGSSAVCWHNSDNRLFVVDLTGNNIYDITVLNNNAVSINKSTF